MKNKTTINLLILNKYILKNNKELIENELNKKYKVTHEKINFSQEDGTFHICFNDFRKLSNKLFICKNLFQIY